MCSGIVDKFRKLLFDFCFVFLICFGVLSLIFRIRPTSCNITLSQRLNLIKSIIQEGIFFSCFVVCFSDFG